jgi:protein-arginine kinase activator protein McsA
MELYKKNPKKVLKDKKRQMEEAVSVLDFETAAILRDEIHLLENSDSKSKKRNGVS